MNNGSTPIVFVVFLPIARLYKRLLAASFNGDFSILLRTLTRRLEEDVNGRRVPMFYTAADNTAVALEDKGDLEISCLLQENCRFIRLDVSNVLLSGNNQKQQVADLAANQSASVPYLAPPPASSAATNAVSQKSNRDPFLPPPGLLREERRLESSRPQAPPESAVQKVEVGMPLRLPAKVASGSVLRLEIPYNNVGTIPIMCDATVYLRLASSLAVAGGELIDYTTDFLRTETPPGQGGTLVVNLVIPKCTETRRITYRYSIVSPASTPLVCGEKAFELTIEPSNGAPTSTEAPKDSESSLYQIDVLEQATGQPRDVVEKVYARHKKNLDLALEELMSM